MVCQRGHFPVILLVPVTLKELAAVGKITEKELKSVSKEIDSLQNNLSTLYEKNK